MIAANEVESGRSAPDLDLPAIRVRNLENRFGDFVVHENLDLDVRQREILAVVGGSGSGKSVLMRAILALRPPQQGEIEVFGHTIDPHAERQPQLEQQAGVLFQDGALFSSLTVLENVEMPLKAHRPELSDDLCQELARLRICLSGLPRSAGDKLPSELSGGMRKRASLARALALEPKLLFLDEPTAGLDPIGAAAFDQLLLTLKQSLGLTVFLITHDLDTIYTICDRVAVIGERKVLAIGSIDEVADNDNPWIQDYFHGPRGRAASNATASRMKV